MSNIAIAREEIIFVVPETNYGTLAYPSSSNLVIAAGNGTISQNLTFTESEELRDTRSLIARFRDKIPAGTWSFPTYIRPSGSAGTPPMGDTLFEALLGKKETGSDVKYSPAKILPSFSLWVKKSHTVFFADGCVVNEGRLSVTSKGAASVEWSGNFRRMGWVGTDKLAAAVTTGATSITVNDGSKFTVGGRIVIGDNDNSGQGYRVTAVDGNTLTIDPGISSDVSAGAVVKPWLPDTSGVNFGDVLENREFSLSIGGVDRIIRTFECTITNNVSLVEDELTGDLYPTEKIEGDRRVTGRLTLYFRKDELDWFKNAYDGNDVAVELVGGSEAGSIFKVSIPRASLDVPSVTTEAPAIALEVGFTALANNGEDEIQIIFQ